MNYGEKQSPDWIRLTAGEFEHIVAMLLFRQHPDGQRFDGRGGDGGVDFVVDGAGGRIVYQIKHFTQRLGGPQRKQTTRSLDRLAGEQISEWILIVPIDLTPAEDQWFQSLDSESVRVRRWLGGTWLDQQIARHDDIRFAQLNSAGAARAEIQDRLRKVGNPVVSLDDVVQSQASLARVAATLSPAFDVYTSSSPDGTHVRLAPKPGTEFRLDLEQLRKHAGEKAFEHLGFGRAVEFQAPPSLIGLPSDLFGGDLGHWTLGGESGPAIRLRLEAVTEKGWVLAELPFPEVTGTRGFAGIEFETSHPSDWMTATTRMTPTNAAVSFTIDTTPAAYPHDLIHVVDFHEAARGSGHVRVVLTVHGQEMKAEPVPISIDEELIGPGFNRYVHDALFLQRCSGHRHRISVDGADDAHDLRELVRMIEGEVLHPSATLTVELTSIPDDLRASRGVGQSVAVRQELLSFTIQGEEHRPRGLVRQLTCDNTEIDNWNEAVATFSLGQGGTATFRPAPGHEWNMSMGEAGPSSG